MARKYLWILDSKNANMPHTPDIYTPNIGNIMTFQDRKLYMKTCFNSKSLWIFTISFVWFFESKYPNTLKSQNIPGGKMS